MSHLETRAARIGGSASLPRQHPALDDDPSVADELSVSLNTVYKWSARGPWFPKAIRLRNGNVRIRRDWYEAWLAEQPAHGGPAALRSPQKRP